jgi:hypothetical protein
MESAKKDNDNKTLKDKKSKKKKKSKKNRCVVCNKKLGLLPFKCKCDSKKLFCSVHRYPCSHDCTFDWKKEGRERLEKENPKVGFDKFKGDKIQ